MPYHYVLLAILAEWNAGDDFSFLLAKDSVDERLIPPFSIGVNEGADCCIFWEYLPRGLDSIRRRSR